MLQIGRFNKLKVVKHVNFGVYLDSDEGEILMPTKYVPEGTEVGDEIDAFIYTDSEDRLIATTLKPLAQEGEFACLAVKHTTDFGAFLEWGLEKDLFVPVSEQHKRMRVGEKHIVRVVLDQRTNRLVGIGKISSFIEKEDVDLEEGEEVDLLVYEVTDLGIMCIVNDRYAGMLYKNEVFRDLEAGERTTGYVKKLREDNKIDLSLRRQGFRAMQGEESVIMDKLKASGGFLPYGDHSSPEEIKAAFQMSKKMFKKLIGGLYKKGIINISDRGIDMRAE